MQVRPAEARHAQQCRCVTEERKTASVWSEAEQTLSTWSWYFKENHSLARQTTTFCLVLQSRHMFAYASPQPASFVFACSCGRTFNKWSVPSRVANEFTIIYVLMSWTTGTFGTFNLCSSITKLLTSFEYL